MRTKAETAHSITYKVIGDIEAIRNKKLDIITYPMLKPLLADYNEVDQFHVVLNMLRNKMAESQFAPDTTGKKNVLRALIRSVGDDKRVDISEDFWMFLLELKELVRMTNTVCVITMPFTLIEKIVSVIYNFRIAFRTRIKSN